MELRWGVTRTVILTKNHAFKVPSLESWRQFLLGLLANMEENLFSGSDERYCPVKFAMPGGWLLVMPRCEEVKEVEIDYSAFADLSDQKQCNFGRYKGQIVLLDYGS